MNSSNCVQWTSPSNIALIKYWGKRKGQLPQNPSLSLTLKKAVSTFSLTWMNKKEKRPQISLLFDGKEHSFFEQRIRRFIQSIEDRCPFLLRYDLYLESSNSFPHSTGIASSASSMSALALCLCSMEKTIQNTLLDNESFTAKAACLARLASGSATRSLFSPVACWGENPLIPHSSNYKGVEVCGLHSIFYSYKNAILLVDTAVKKISSSEGHKLMNGHMAEKNRYTQARIHFERLHKAMRCGDLKTFVEVVEMEAMTLHGLLATSSPSFFLLRPVSVAVMEKIVDFRTKHGHPVCFTLDAGPNIHLLYPKKIASVVESFIHRELLPLLPKGRWMSDEVGGGPRQV